MWKICSPLACALFWNGLLSGPATAQSPPATDIHWAALQRSEDGVLELEYRGRATDRDGYDNQPSFLPDGTGLLYTSIRDEQADIYRFEFASRRSVRLTRTEESEYSPKVMPGGKGFSVVRVETPEPLVQRLWRFDLDGGGASCLLDDVNPVGYHAWGDADSLGLFVLGEPPTLRMARLKERTRAIKADTIGRCLTALSWREELRPFLPAVSFVDRTKPEEAWIRTLELTSGEVHPVVKALDGVDDHVWTRQGELLSARGSQLFVHGPGRGEGWTEVGDLQSSKVSSITRLAVSRDGTKLAFVAGRPPPERDR